MRDWRLDDCSFQLRPGLCPKALEYVRTITSMPCGSFRDCRLNWAGGDGWRFTTSTSFFAISGIEECNGPSHADADNTPRRVIIHPRHFALNAHIYLRLLHFVLLLNLTMGRAKNKVTKVSSHCPISICSCGYRPKHLGEGTIPPLSGNHPRKVHLRVTLKSGGSQNNARHERTSVWVCRKPR